MLNSWATRILPALAFVAFMAQSDDAQAKKFALITHGDSISHVQGLDANAKTDIETRLGPGVAVGYKYSQFGVFFMDVWTWDGEYVLFRDDEYWDVEGEELVKLAGVVSIDDLGKPWSYSFPPGLLALLALAIGYGLYMKFGKDDEELPEEGESEVG